MFVKRKVRLRIYILTRILTFRFLLCQYIYQGSFSYRYSQLAKVVFGSGSDTISPFWVGFRYQKTSVPLSGFWVFVYQKSGSCRVWLPFLGFRLGLGTKMSDFPPRFWVPNYITSFSVKTCCQFSKAFKIVVVLLI